MDQKLNISQRNKLRKNSNNNKLKGMKKITNRVVQTLLIIWEILVMKMKDNSHEKMKNIF